MRDRLIVAVAVTCCLITGACGSSISGSAQSRLSVTAFRPTPGAGERPTGSVQCAAENDLSPLPNAHLLGATPQLDQVVKRWPREYGPLTDGPASEHYRELFSGEFGAADLAVRRMGKHGAGPFDVMFFTRAGGYDTDAVREFRSRFVRECLATYPRDVFQGNGGVFGNAASFAFSARGVAVIVFFSDLLPDDIAKLVEALRR